MYWAHVVCLDPKTGAPLHVTANQLWGPVADYLSPPDPRSGPVGGAAMPPENDAGTLGPLHGKSAWPLGEGAAGARATHDGRPGHSRFDEGGDGVERTALPLEMYSDMIHVCIDGPSPPDAQPPVIPAATASHAHPEAAAAGHAPRMPAYPPIGPVTTARVLRDPRSDVHVADALEEQAALMNGQGSSPPDPEGESPAPVVPAAQHGAAASPPPGAQHAPPAQPPGGAPPPWGHEHVPGEAAAEEGPPSAWRCRVERACRVAAAKSHVDAGAAGREAAVQLKMRIAMEYCDLGALRVLRVLGALCGPCAAVEDTGACSAAASSGCLHEHPHVLLTCMVPRGRASRPMPVLSTEERWLALLLKPRRGAVCTVPVFNCMLSCRSTPCSHECSEASTCCACSEAADGPRRTQHTPHSRSFV